MYVPYALTFDGSNDYLLRSSDLLSSADIGQGACTFWLKPPSSAPASAMYILTNALKRFAVWIDTDGKLYVIGKNTSNTKVMGANSAAVICDGAWKWFGIQWYLNAGYCHILQGDSQVQTNGVATAGQSIDITGTAWAIGAATDGTTKFAGGLSDLFFGYEYLGLLTASNRRKFYSASGKPVYAGADGSTPTGVAPWIYMRMYPIGTNLGIGGAFVKQGAPVLSRGPIVRKMNPALFTNV